jgi:hypothetical protein
MVEIFMKTTNHSLLYSIVRHVLALLAMSFDFKKYEYGTKQLTFQNNKKVHRTG